MEEDVTKVPSGVVVSDGPYFLNDIISWDNLSADKNFLKKFLIFIFSWNKIFFFNFYKIDYKFCGWLQNN